MTLRPSTASVIDLRSFKNLQFTSLPGWPTHVTSSYQAIARPASTVLLDCGGCLYFSQKRRRTTLSLTLELYAIPLLSLVETDSNTTELLESVLALLARNECDSLKSM